MHGLPTEPPSLTERMTHLLQRGVRLAARVAVAFGLSTIAAIGLAIAISDNAFVQILVMILGALGFWIPFLLLVLFVERLFQRRPAPPRHGPANSALSNGEGQEGWRRLSAAAPRQAERLDVLRRSLGESRLALGKAQLDADAHDLCVLIDRRLPELIHRELDNLPPDDRNRSRQIGELVDLIEQFARHCSRKRSGDADAVGQEAAILRRRFEEHLTGRQGPDLLS
jgi:hypothetical protein